MVIKLDLDYILYCYKCNSYIMTDDIEFKEYNDKLFTCNRCLNIKPKQKYAIDSDIYSGLTDRRNECIDKDLEHENNKPPKKRRKTDK